MGFIQALSTNGVAVIGAGTMGSGIAQKIAQVGIPVFLVDRQQHLAEAGKDQIVLILSQAVERKIFRPDEVSTILARVTPTADLGALEDVALVIEAVFEDRDVKQELFQQLHEICGPETIFATNTSSLSVTELAETSGRRDRFGGLHFFYHPAKNRLLEIITAASTSQETERSLRLFGSVIGKTCIKVADRPGFAVNRFFVPWLNEAVRIFEEGIASISTIEAAARRAFGIGMGPFELMNVTGVPIAYHAAMSLERSLGRFYAPAARLANQAERRQNWDLDGEEVDETQTNDVAERLLGCVFTIACTLVDEGVASREDTDRGAVVGLRWRQGPFAMMNRCGLSASQELVARFTARHATLAQPQGLEAQAQTNEPWPLSFVDMEKSQGSARIIINRPEALNALNPDVVRQLAARFEQATHDPSVETIVFEGVGKAFVAGADIRFFVDALIDDDFERIYTFTRQGQELFKAIATSEKLTVAFVDGMALGGGVELALACRKIVATSQASFAFPETGIGIYPGLGGTQRLPRKIGKPLARYLILCGQTLGVRDAFSFGLVDALMNGEPAKEEVNRTATIVTRARQSDEKTPGADQAPEWVSTAEFLFSDERVGVILGKDIPDLPDGASKAFAEKVAKRLGYKAPIALRIASQLIEEGFQTSLEEGIQKELDHLEEIFSTEDALEGLSSVGKRRAHFKGQ